jgi:hypothetical protein
MNRYLTFLLGVILGLVGGLYYSWALDPAEYVDTSPASLKPEFQEDYLALIASAFSATGDLERAQARLAQLPDPNPANTLNQLAQTRLAQSGPQSEARALALLAAALGPQPSPFPSPTAPLTKRTPSRTETTPTEPPTTTPAPTRTATPTPGAPFELVDREQICDPAVEAPLLQIVVLDAAGRPIPGVEALAVWDNGQDRFFTGLKPELGLGYADFAMQPGVLYTLQLASVETTVTGLQVETCEPETGELYPGSILLTFQQPEQP